jgi:hypothetical protein
MATTTTTPAFSSNYDAEQGEKDLTPLLKIDGGKWTLISSGKGVERSFKFKTFKKTWVCFSNSHLHLHLYSCVHIFAANISYYYIRRRNITD